MSKKILIVDDDESITESLSILLKRSGHLPIVAFNPEQALHLMSEHQADLILQDMNFSRQTSGEEGVSLLKDIRRQNTQIPVILMTAWASVDLAVQGMKQGANDFFAKPWSNERLLQCVNTALALRQPKAEYEATRQELDSRYDFSSIIGEDPELLKILSTVGRISETDASVLILGESGTGKELIANAVHNNSHRKNFSHIKVNLGGVPGNLFESELFGHLKGAFTDAKSDREGYFGRAHKGSIFLDEIGDLEKSSQVKLLRVLQDQSYQPLGSSKTLSANVRVIAATNRNLTQLVASKQFREDLLYRINLITIHLPPLRKRKGDILLIAEHVLQSLCQRYNFDQLILGSGARQWLQTQSWPGNIRQLTQTLERAVLMSESTTLDEQAFLNSEQVGESLEQSDTTLPVGSMTLAEMEIAMIRKALHQYQNNLSQVASALGLSRQSLYRRLEKHGVQL